MLDLRTAVGPLLGLISQKLGHPQQDVDLLLLELELLPEPVDLRAALPDLCLALDLSELFQFTGNLVQFPLAGGLAATGLRSVGFEGGSSIHSRPLPERFRSAGKVA